MFGPRSIGAIRLIEPYGGGATAPIRDGPGPARNRGPARSGARPVRAIVAAVTTRYRCTACGNLTRFDVTTSRRTRAFHHFTVGGVLSIEDTEVLAESVDEVLCRWCGTGANVTEVSEDEATALDAGGDDAAPG